MSKKNIVLITFTLLLGGVYIYFFTDFFNKPVIQISARTRAVSARQSNSSSPQVSFSFDGKYKLTALKVVPAAEFETNKYAHPIWNLFAETNSVPTKGIIYGFSVAGMKPARPRGKAEPLQPNVKYRLLVEAGARKGETDFQIPGTKI
ncbi:MAG: hypothetical protein M3Y82_01480 [Verrucomicrobiota bacterium]|nr:hypothetical protein [Verrucomicrobiota bacterium]